MPKRSYATKGLGERVKTVMLPQKWGRMPKRSLGFIRHRNIMPQTDSNTEEAPSAREMAGKIPWACLVEKACVPLRERLTFYPANLRAPYTRCCPAANLRLIEAGTTQGDTRMQAYSYIK